MWPSSSRLSHEVSEILGKRLKTGNEVYVCVLMSQHEQCVEEDTSTQFHELS